MVVPFIEYRAWSIIPNKGDAAKRIECAGIFDASAFVPRVTKTKY